MATKLAFAEEEMAVDEGLGYPRAYAELCRSPSVLNPYIKGPPFAFAPYVLQPQEALRAKDLNQMFPIIDPEAKPSANPRGYVNLLWKQLDHLGNAGFDPALFRVDPYGNVLYLHADSASPLAWDIDHWFPCSRGGRTGPSNLRILQWQLCRKKQNKLDFLIPWWDLQLGVSVNQFLSIFASRNSDFRNRAFSFLFSNGGSEELNALQAMDSHSFPQHFIDMKRQVGLAPAAIVSSQRSTDATVLKSLDFNRSLSYNSPLSVARKYSAEEDDAPSMAIQKFRPNISKENENPNIDAYNYNPHLSITVARDSMRHKEETKKKQAEINWLEDELNELKKKNEAERVSLQELEELLIKRRRRVEKCRRLAEAQSSYRALLEKMIRDAMHQCVVYKEQVRLNQAATSALMARLEAQRANCDSSETELCRKFKRRDEIEKQIKPSWEQARKRSRMDDTMFDERFHENIQLSTRKELREFLEEAQKASEAELSVSEKEEEEEIKEEESANTIHQGKDGKYKTMVVAKSAMLKNLAIREGSFNRRTPAPKKKASIPRNHQEEDEEDCRTMAAAKAEISLEDKLKKLKIREEFCHYANGSKKQNPQEDDEEEYRRLVDSNDEISIDDKLVELATRGPCSKTNGLEKSKFFQNLCGDDDDDDDDDDECKKRVGKGNVEKWLQILLENAEGSSGESPPTKPDRQENHTEVVCNLKFVNHQKEEIEYFSKPLEDNVGFDLRLDRQQIKERNSSENGTDEDIRNNIIGSRKSFEVRDRVERKGEGIAKSDSARAFRSLPSSPSVVLGMRRGMDCMGKKPKVLGDEDFSENSMHTSNRFIKTCTKAIKKAVNK